MPPNAVVIDLSHTTKLAMAKGRVLFEGHIIRNYIPLEKCVCNACVHTSEKILPIDLPAYAGFLDAGRESSSETTVVLDCFRCDEVADTTKNIFTRTPEEGCTADGCKNCSRTP